MKWEPVFFVAKKGSFTLNVWQGHDGAWRASVHYKHQMTGMEGKKLLSSIGAARKYALKLLRIYKKNRSPRALAS